MSGVGIGDTSVESPLIRGFFGAPAQERRVSPPSAISGFETSSPGANPGNGGGGPSYPFSESDGGVTSSDAVCANLGGFFSAAPSSSLTCWSK